MPSKLQTLDGTMIYVNVNAKFLMFFQKTITGTKFLTPTQSYLICFNAQCNVTYVCSGLSGYLVFNFMHSYHNERLHYCIPTGDYLLKRRFVTHILKHELNEVVDNISPEERDVLDRIEKWTFTDLIE